MEFKNNKFCPAIKLGCNINCLNHDLTRFTGFPLLRRFLAPDGEVDALSEP